MKRMLLLLFICGYALCYTAFGQRSPHEGQGANTFRLTPAKLMSVISAKTKVPAFEKTLDQYEEHFNDIDTAFYEGGDYNAYTTYSNYHPKREMGENISLTTKKDGVIHSIRYIEYGPGFIRSRYAEIVREFRASGFIETKSSSKLTRFIRALSRSDRTFWLQNPKSQVYVKFHLIDEDSLLVDVNDLKG